jgi:hypothetical protein
MLMPALGNSQSELKAMHARQSCHQAGARTSRAGGGEATTAKKQGARQKSRGNSPTLKGKALDKVATTVGKDRKTLEPAARSVAQLLPPLGRRACFLNVAISVAINRNLRRQV